MPILFDNEERLGVAVPARFWVGSSGIWKTPFPTAYYAVHRKVAIRVLNHIYLLWNV